MVVSCTCHGPVSVSYCQGGQYSFIVLLWKFTNKKTQRVINKKQVSVENLLKVWISRCKELCDQDKNQAKLPATNHTPSNPQPPPSEPSSEPPPNNPFLSENTLALIERKTQQTPRLTLFDKVNYNDHYKMHFLISTKKFTYSYRPYTITIYTSTFP